ncbi:cytochrome P450 [Fomitiporia mediterranea MF3/22]|uniref:cytochrome P450 n=1 Tax=Fomitiporia mediterranea (strain MF3/22) TaxID=694068 RepID=UPI0004407815|nr:cytochrome P450 [Fomitiporia mediterranea MF3/22]EJD07780.1 cytochrome P450 [Fomitiporia mediterranea MF3/22]
MCVASIVICKKYFLTRSSSKIAVPAVGPAGWLTSYYGALKFITSSRAMLQEGYDKFKSRTFKVPQMRHWLVVVNTPELIDEVRRAPDNKLSFMEATRDSISSEFTMGRLVDADLYHVPIVRTQLTRSISGLFEGIKEEIELGFEEGINAKGSEWVSRPALSTVMQVVGRASNRVFVGLPLCRNKDYLELNVRFTIDVIKAAQIIRMFPVFMKGIVGELLTSVPASTRRGIKHLAPIIEYRLKQMEEHGNEWPGKPNDMLTWIIDEAPNDEQKSVQGLTQRILSLNFAAIHTSSHSFTHGLLHLAAHPEYIAPMREEAERVIESDGWTKLSMQKMRKIDSFLKESQRFSGLGNISMTRKALADYKLSDGTFLPKGSFVTCNAYSVHRNDGVYADASEFRPFRFSDHREESAEEATHHQLVSTSNEFLPFGHGRHACPGRFFAANELKAMMAYLVLNYDMKLPDGQDRPKDLEFDGSLSPNPKAHVLFRRRQT